MSLLDEEFDVLEEDELALLTWRFERMHENWVNSRRNTRICFQCGKPGHFVVDCPEKVENKDNYKHKSKTDDKYRSRHDHKHKQKGKNKDERRSRKKESRGKARAMVGASDVNSSSAYSTSSSSSSEDEGDLRKGRKPSKNLSGLSCFARDVFCTMSLSSGSKKSNQSDSDSDSNSDDEVRDELPFLRQENERLGLLLDNRDDMLREAMKMRKELRASLEDARTTVAELETQNLDAKLEIDSLMASPIVSDEVECADCLIFLADLAMFKEKHASKCEELDVLRVEAAELKSRPALLGACTSCPILHGKFDEMHAYIVSLEAKLK
jgi:hypothetical protein